MIKHQQSTDELAVGERIYYTGDMANQPAWLTVTALDRAANHIAVLWDDGRTDVLFPGQIGRTYEGHANPRFYPEHAVNVWRETRIRAMEEAIARNR